MHAPDLCDGRTCATLEDGLGHARAVGFDSILASGVRAADELPHGLVYAGFSLGVMPAQQLAQTRAGAGCVAAAFLSACVGVRFLAGRCAGAGHGMDADAFVVDDGDLDAARALVRSAEDAELFLYSGDQHLLADSSCRPTTPRPTRCSHGECWTS